jgi:flavin reductase (DIM6/NTAB) family NADH-FMN oxidoreductase RutF
MSQFREIRPEEWEGNVFSQIGKDWMLIGAGEGEKSNLMTASWGAFGVLLRLPVAHCYVRPQRHTRHLIDQAERYSLLFFDNPYREQLNLCGTKSGREIDKFEACGFTRLFDEHGTVYVPQARAVVFCRKLYQQDMESSSFLDREIPSLHYSDEDFHRHYIGEITKILVK